MFMTESLRQTINSCLRELPPAVLREFDLGLAATVAKERTEVVKAREIETGYTDGSIAGSNKESRERAETVFLAGNHFYRQYLAAQRATERSHARAKAELEGLRQRISFVKAFVYSDRPWAEA